MTTDGENGCYQSTVLPTSQVNHHQPTYTTMDWQKRKRPAQHMGREIRKNQLVVNKRALESNLRLHRSTYITNISIIIRSKPMGKFTNHSILSVQVDPVNLSRYVIYYLPIIHYFGCLIYQLSLTLPVSSM